MIKNIVFDFGGVICDIAMDPAIKAFKSLGVRDIEVWVDPYEQKGIFRQVETGELTMEEFVTTLNKLVGKELDTQKIQQAWQSFITGINVEKLRFIKELRKKYKVYMLSNTNPFIMQWTNSPDLSEDGMPLSAYFDKMFLSYEMGLTKPDPRIFTKMIEETGLVPQETMFIDDGQANIDTASELGFQTYKAEAGEDWEGALLDIFNKAKV